MADLGLSKYAKDAVLIAFSILLALMIDKSVEAWQTNSREEDAREAITPAFTIDDGPWTMDFLSGC